MVRPEGSWHQSRSSAGYVAGDDYDRDMAKAGETVAVYETEDGMLLFGSEAALELFDTGLEVVSKPLSTQHLARAVGYTGTAGGKLIAESGRWVKLTSESAAIAEAAVGGTHKLTSGVMRKNNGQILKHVKFENVSKVGALTPAAPAVLGAMATQYAIESALDDITAYLEEIDRKLDQLLKLHKTNSSCTRPRRWGRSAASLSPLTRPPPSSRPPGRSQAPRGPKCRVRRSPCRRCRRSRSSSFMS